MARPAGLVRKTGLDARPGDRFAGGDQFAECDAEGLTDQFRIEMNQQIADPVRRGEDLLAPVRLGGEDERRAGGTDRDGRPIVDPAGQRAGQGQGDRQSPLQRRRDEVRFVEHGLARGQDHPAREKTHTVAKEFGRGRVQQASATNGGAARCHRAVASIVVLMCLAGRIGAQHLRNVIHPPPTEIYQWQDVEINMPHDRKSLIITIIYFDFPRQDAPHPEVHP